MTKTIHNILSATLLAACTFIAAPALADTPSQDMAEMAAPEANPVTISANGSNVTVKNAEGCVVQVFSITGKMEMTQKVDSPSVSFDLSNLPKGIYLVKVGKTTVKVYLR